MISDKKILFSTVYKRHRNDVYDYWSANTQRTFFRFTLFRPNSFGLRFLKQNIPELEILEFPTWEEYITKLGGEEWDAVGFSFYLNEIHEIIEMAKYAREQGIKEIWAGNYGALTEGIEKYFSRIFNGYSEDQLAQYLGKSVPNEKLIHPPLIGHISTVHGIRVNCVGYLFTNRGCNNRCEFCQTPPFCKKPYKIPIESIENVLRYYHKLGITQVIILDESFGLFKKHAEEVISLLDKYGFYWFPMVRADYLAKRLNDWSKKGLAGALTGIENLNQKTLDSLGKKVKVEDIISVIKKLEKMNKMAVGFYMIEFENETIESIKKDLKVIAKLRMDITQLCVLTPLPKTPQWYKIEKEHGIFDKDWHHYNAKHLVWNHPNITPEEMGDLLNWGFRLTYPRIRPFETAKSYITRYLERGLIDGTRYTIKHFIHANKFDYHPKEKRFLPVDGHDKSFKSATSPMEFSA